MLKGHINAQSMSKTLNVSHVTIYNDIKFLTKKSKQYVYDMAKGTHVLMFQRALEGLSLALSEVWYRLEDKNLNEKYRVAYLRLVKEINESMIGLATNGGPIEMAVLDMTRRAERLGFDSIIKPMALTEEEQIQYYIHKLITRIID
jgi:hypothetical protein